MHQGPNTLPSMFMVVKDFILFYSKNDEPEAKAFKEKVEREGKDITGYLYNHFNPKDVNFQSIDEICSKGVQTWFFITDNFISDLKMQFLKDELLMRSIINGSKCFVPIWAKPKHEFKDIPFGLAAFFGLDVSDSRLMARIMKMFNQPGHIKAKEELLSKKEPERHQEETEHQKQEEERIMEERNTTKAMKDDGDTDTSSMEKQA